MRTIETTGTVTEDGVLTVSVPRDVLPGRHAVVVVIDEQTQTPKQRDANGWPEGFFETTFGSMADDPIERGDLGDPQH